MTVSPSGITVRMYRQGLGDCFLLGFPRAHTTPFFMLIDCGLIVGQGAGRPDIRQVVRHIAASTGKHLNLVVATHQHWDHLSGFIDANDEFKDIRIDDIWLAWTEDPKDPVANVLRKQSKKIETTLRAASHYLQQVAPAPRDVARTDWVGAFNNVLGFLGAGGDRSTEAALEALGGLCSHEPHYCRPSDSPASIPDVEGVRVYVLGPPHDEKKIKRYNDSAVDPQTYHIAEAAADAQATFLAAAFPDSAEANDESLKDPFDPCEQITRRHARERFAALDRSAFGGGDAWRRISTDWIRAAAGLALQLDNATNNTSLALAIELSPRGKVLLFAADAQVGNWLSWHDQSWTGPDGSQVTAADLLTRTVLYKVGHHASHNATLRQRGLELMTSEELIAMIPLDRQTAKKKGWVMPWPKLRDSLVAATKGRILEVDDEKTPAERPRPEGISAAAWKKFQASVTATEVYYELKIAR